MPWIIHIAGCNAAVVAHHCVTSRFHNCLRYCFFFCRCGSSSCWWSVPLCQRGIMNQNSEIPATLVGLVQCSRPQTELWQGQYCLTSFNILQFDKILTKTDTITTSAVSASPEVPILIVHCHFFDGFDINVWSLTTDHWNFLINIIITERKTDGSLDGNSLSWVLVVYCPGS